MHPIQQKLLELADRYSLGQMALRKIGELIGSAHPQNVKYHLEQLEAKGFLDIDRDSGFIKKVAQGSGLAASLISVPILGAANCGEASLFAEERIEGYLKLSKSMLKKRAKIYAIQAVGLSMNAADVDGKAIEEGDYVIVDSEARSPKDGDYVVSVIDGMANIKKFLFDRQNNQIILISESDQNLPPIYIHPDDLDDYMVSGNVIQVIKKPKI
ncbi:MAG: S24 family peptidase [Pseudomonadota bacterium]